MENMRARGRGRRGRGRARGRATLARKKSIERKEDIVQSADEDDEKAVSPVASSPPHQIIEPTNSTIVLPSPLDIEADISQLEAPTFTTLSRGPPEPMLRLTWGHAVNLIGEKVANPMLHCCDTCLRPILIYGRMIPCKHVFCLSCAKRDSKVCSRCSDKVLRVEQTGLGTVFMCTHGGSRYGNKGCRRTYLSQRDLQAHINHRHISGGVPATMNVTPGALQLNKNDPVPTTVVPPPSAYYQSPKAKLYEKDDMSYGPPRGPTEAPAVTVPPPQILRPAGNLITVPIQEPPPMPDPYFKPFSHPPPSAPPPPAIPSQPMPFFSPAFDYPPPDTSVPPPNQWPGNPPFYG